MINSVNFFNNPYEIGTYGKWGCIGYNAQQAIAIYNICQLDHFDISIYEIIDMLRQKHGLRLFGRWGTRLRATKKVLNILGFDVQRQGRFYSIQQLFNHNYFFVVYMTNSEERGRELHYQAGRVHSYKCFELFYPNHKYESVELFYKLEEVQWAVVYTVD